MSESSRLLWIDCSFVLGQVDDTGGNHEWLLPPEAWLPTGKASQFLISVEADVSAYGATGPEVTLTLETPTAESPRTDAFEPIGIPVTLVREERWYEFDIGRHASEDAVRGLLRLRATNDLLLAVDACVRIRVWVSGQTLPANGTMRTWGRG